MSSNTVKRLANPNPLKNPLFNPFGAPGETIGRAVINPLKNPLLNPLAAPGFVSDLGGSLGLGGKKKDNTGAKINAELKGLSNQVDKTKEGGVYDRPEYLLDNVTREELRGLIQQKKLGEATKLFNAARIGTDAKFRARVGTQAMYETMLDKPGAAQTRVASLLDAYKGQR